MDKACKSMTQELKSVDMKQVSNAIKALQKYFKTKQSAGGKKSLLEDEDCFVHLCFTLTQVPVNPSPRPVQLVLPKPFYSENVYTRVCIFVKDPESDFKQQIQNLKIPCIAEVIGFDRLKRDFRQFKDKRQLLNDFDLFLADIRIYKMLPECLGKEFYSKKAFPCPIKVHGFDTPKELEQQLNQASSSSYFTSGNGPNYSVKIGKVSQDAKDIIKNIDAVAGKVLGNVTCWDDIKFDKI